MNNAKMATIAQIGKSHKLRLAKTKELENNDLG
jgi:hypothetical protein